MYGRGFPGGPQMSFGPPITPPVIKQLMIANAVVFVLDLLLKEQLQFLGGVRPLLFWQQGHLWTPFTYMWLHAGLAHIAMNMFILWSFGSQLALLWGPSRFLRYYLFCGVGAGVVIAILPVLFYAIGLAHPIELTIPTVGASGAIYGVILAYSLTWPNRTLMLIFPPVAFRAIWMIPVMFLMTVMFGGANISHTGHLGGVLAGWIALRRQGHAGRLISLEELRARWRRFRMRRKLRAVRFEEWEAEQRRRDSRYH